jgi:hypothetical protein
MWSSSICGILPFLIGCQPAPPPSPVTISNPISYLSDPTRTVRYDIGHYQETVSYKLDDSHAVATWDYPRFGVYDPTTGDGGEQYVIEGNTVRIEGTRDGGRPINQYFVGKDCGGTGWVLFRTDADSSWREMVAKLSISADPTKCSAGSSALTRYSVKSVNFPYIGTRNAIVSEHYNSGSIKNSVAMERSFFVPDLGRVVWQALTNQPPTVPDLATRCPDFGWNTAGSLHVTDCRISTQLGGPASNDLWKLGR